MKVKVFAKLNVTLNVFDAVGAFHPVDSIVTSVDVFDVVQVVARQDKNVTVCGMDDVAMQNNTAFKAAIKFVEMFSCCGVDVCVQKGIPFSSGMGGSSADAAAVVWCMCKLFGIDQTYPQVKQVCASVGSDVYFMLFGGLARMQGKGEELLFAMLPQPLHFVVTTFDVGITAKQAYSAWDKTGGALNADNDFVLRMLTKGDNNAFCHFGNGLQRATNSINGYATNFLTFAQTLGVCPIMTGSGSAYFVPCGDSQQAQRLAMAFCQNGFDSFACQSVAQGIEIVQ